ncbi:MAG: hypothetical protein QMC83_01895 [Thermodesulfovibrionales bacterium]|nr:hypothetical protein [Thermodesulfovibrionales bacterium]
MRGNEKQVLKIVAELKEADREAIARKVGVSTEYVTEICQGLVKDGYLIERGNGRFQLTGAGQKAISPVRTTGPIPVLKGGG